MLLGLVLLLFCVALVPVVGLLCVCLYIALYRSCRSDALGRSAAVVVLGDIGRSPRMCYHVESLANDGWKVAIVGYSGVAVPAPLQRSSVRHQYLQSPPKWIATLPRHAFVLVAPFKLLLQSVSLFWELGVKVHPPPQFVLVQTPPALPTLIVVKVVAALVRAKVVIDWHNLAYTILALRLGPASRVVRLAEKLEQWTGRTAYAHLFVTEAMKVHLERRWALVGHKKVLHDRPPAHFRRSTVNETHELMTRLLPTLQLGADFMPGYTLPRSTAFTQRESGAANGDVQWRQDRPALVVSSTSWTADEDFGLLLEAARIYERRAGQLASSGGVSDQEALSPILPPSAGRRRPSMDTLRSATLPNEPIASPLPRLLILVTGKGELKAHYVAQIAQLERQEQWKYVRIRTAWLETHDYPVLLGAADVGVSLHTSSSGLDLPMKVVDMLGCGLPVCALDFACLDELVRDRVNGLVFRTPQGLARQWESLLVTHPAPPWLSTEPGMLRPFEKLIPASASSAGVGPETAVPPSPNPSLTLLPSPLWGPGTSPAPDSFPRSNWPGNWKAVVRPLLSSTSHAVPSNQNEHQSVDLQPAGNLLSRRAKQRRLVHTQDLDHQHLLSPTTSTPSYSDEEDFTNPVDIVAASVPHTHSKLRNRKNSATSSNSPLIGATSTVIPHIHVSHQL